MKFYLGTHRPSWLARTDVPLFVSRRVMPKAKFPQAIGSWALDSGGFTELSMFGEWRTTEDEYVADALRYEDEIGLLNWVAPQDWMCEPFMLEKTGLTVREHQQRTVESFLRLADRLGDLVIPVLQGWTRDDYLRCWADYEYANVDLSGERTVGLGSICRRQNTAEVGRIMRSLQPLNLHAFGVKLTGLESYGDALHSADSMAWSYRARRDHPMRGHTHKSCANCLPYALRWRDQVLARLGQQRLEVECVA